MATGKSPSRQHHDRGDRRASTYVKGNAGGLQNLAGLSATQAADAAGQWIEFSTDNAAFAQVVVGVRSHDVANELALKGPLTLGHPQHARRARRRRHRGHPDLRPSTAQHVVLYVRATRHPRPGRGGHGRRQGPADRRRARHLLEVGRDGAAEGTAGHHHHRAGQRRLTRDGRTPTPTGAPDDVGGWETSPHRSSRRIARRRPAPQESEGHAPPAPIPFAAPRLPPWRRRVRRLRRLRRATVPGGRRQHADPDAQSEYQAAIKAATSKGVHFVLRRHAGRCHHHGHRRHRCHLGRADAHGEEGSLTEHMTAMVVGSTGYVKGNATALHNVIGLTNAQSNEVRRHLALLPDVQRRARPAGQRAAQLAGGERARR